MAEHCISFNPSVFKPNICRDCFQDEQHHQNTVISNEHRSSAVQTSTCHETTNNNDQYNQNKTATNFKQRSVQPSSQTTMLSQCQYGISCSIRDSNHFEQFLHSPIHERDHTSNTSPSPMNSNNKAAQHSTNEQNMIPSSDILSTKTLPQCKYGLSCYSTHPSHFELYSHPSDRKSQEKSSKFDDVSTPVISNDSPSSMTPTSSPANQCKLKLKRKREERKKSELHFIELIQNKIENLTVQLQLKEEEVTKLSQDLTKLVTYNQQLEMTLEEEIDHRERRELERKQILAIPRQTPMYWGLNAFEESYREIELSSQSPEFNIIKQLLNSTISKHDNQHGTVNNRDPTKFLINRIVRIHNNELWHLYCFKKDIIIRQNNDRLADCGSSIYLETCPVLTPLLDTRTNEYWLFHGCSQNNLYHLLHNGYDPRVSNLKGRFGGGFYLAENSSKSNRYIPCPGCGQNFIGSILGCRCINQEDLEFSMILYRAALGDVHVALKYDREKYSHGPNGQCIRRPPKKAHSKELYDSVMGESMKYGGDRLKHREFILYDAGQAYPEYVIYFRRSAKNPLQPSNIEDLKKKCQHFLVNTFRLSP
ncbi:unnamed protein product [Rotaria sordida]|uniref:Poly [ADP-ribose] polymerase n=1 Tax=Rotaria sordida TaxID=392033 RepID=A0A815AP14_9BILA|nr:unnamed protein product [Rotaria sordida]CAF1540292.1 unnamed protein product [Rotaria sordida]